MSTLPVDPSLAVQEAAQNDLVRRKMDMDALRKRLGDTRTQQQKLRESCEGFESIFIQKMWEQMRKNVSKEGYLHSKDEETYQSLFDVELSKKMASAGGIGLADMLYDQLSQQLEQSGRTTSPSTYRPLLPASDGGPAAEAAKAGAEALAVADLYSPLPQEEEEPADEAPDTISSALDEIRKELALQAETPAAGGAAAEWAAGRAANVGEPPVEYLAAAGIPAEASPAAGTTTAPTGGNVVTNPAAAEAPGSGAIPRTEAASGNPAGGGALSGSQAASAAPAADLGEKELSGLLATSWQGNTNVSATPKPVRLFGRSRGKPAQPAPEAAPRPAAPPRGMAPENALWPADGKIVSGFGWEEDPLTGKRHWNSGVRIAASPGDPVRASLDGTVIFSGPREDFGHTIVLEHNDGFRSYYSNIQADGVEVGDVIPGGANFAKVAAQPSSSPAGANSTQLYFEFKRGEMALNPESAIRRLRTASR